MPAQLDVRAGSVLAALDGDRDGRMSRAEFRLAFEEPE
jgi:hypothetical protein